MSDNKNVEKRDETQELRKERKTFPACCDIYSEGDNVVLQLEMPGVSRENLQVHVDGDLLIVHGNKRIPAVGGEFHIREIPDGDYHQEYTLDDTIDRDKISASINNGIVTITMQLKETVKPRKIKINAK